MTFLYNSIRGLLLTAIAGMVIVAINKEIADIVFRIYIAFMALVGASLIILVMKNNKPTSATYAQNTPYNAQNRHNYRERTHTRDEVSEIVNDNSYTNRINTDDKGSQNRKQCFISFHDIFMPPSMILIIERIISKGEKMKQPNANKT